MLTYQATGRKEKAMTNEQIIFEERCRLMQEGKIGTTGRSITVKTDKGEKTFLEPEPIHTFQVWKELGYSVKKGEHAIAKFTIWKYTADKEDDSEDGHCFMKTAHFFKREQVEPLKA